MIEKIINGRRLRAEENFTIQAERRKSKPEVVRVIKMKQAFTLENVVFLDGKHRVEPSRGAKGDFIVVGEEDGDVKIRKEAYVEQYYKKLGE